MARGDVLFNVLEVLGGTAITGLDLFNAFINAGYGVSQGKIYYEMSKIESRRAAREREAELKQKYYNLLFKLKRDGLIRTEERNHSRFFALTGKGKEKLNKLRLKKEAKLPPAKDYRKEKGGFTIVVFDVPEKERAKRNWIREVLNNLGLEMIQKSVWIGKARIPKQFVDDLDKFRMIDFVEIFEINKTGSLKQVN